MEDEGVWDWDCEGVEEGTLGACDADVEDSGANNEDGLAANAAADDDGLPGPYPSNEGGMRTRRKR